VKKLTAPIIGLNEVKYSLLNVLTEEEVRTSKQAEHQNSRKKSNPLSYKNANDINNICTTGNDFTNNNHNINNPIGISVKNYYAEFSNYESTKCSLNSLHYIKAYAANTNQGIVRYIQFMHIINS